MEHIINKSQKYHYAKEGVLADGTFSSQDIYDSICGLILYYTKSIKEDNYFPDINISKLQKQKNYFSILQSLKLEHFQKINFKDKKMYLSIFLSLELECKNISSRGKI